jgi:hypothetical protein
LEFLLQERFSSQAFYSAKTEFPAEDAFRMIASTCSTKEFIQWQRQ